MENTTPRLKFSRRMVLIFVLLGIIGFFSGVFVGLLPCQHCEKPVLQIGKYKVFGEHHIDRPFRDKWWDYFVWHKAHDFKVIQFSDKGEWVGKTK